MQTTSAARTELSVNGMSCGGCARNVTEALQAVPGVASAVVSLETKTASVRWKPGAASSPDALVHAVTQAGYEAHVTTGAAPSDAHQHKAAQTWGVSVLTGIIPTALLMLGEW